MIATLVVVDVAIIIILRVTIMIIVIVILCQFYNYCADLLLKL